MRAGRRIAEAVRAGARLLGPRRGGSAPLLATLYVTTRCNLRCVYCRLPEEALPELSKADWCRVLDELRDAGCWRVLFFGGEPLLREDIEELVAHARARGLRCAMTSNGMLVPDRPEVLRRLDGLTVSLDGPREAHERNRGPGTFERALAAVEAARRSGVPVKINAVLTSGTAWALDWLVEFSARERLPLSLNPVHGGTNRFEDAGVRERLGEEELRRLFARIVEAARRSPWVAFSPATYRRALGWPDYARIRHREGDGPAPAVPACLAGRRHGVIYTDGSAYPCTLTVGKMPACRVQDVGIIEAFRRSAGHDCRACWSPCMLEFNGLLGLDRAVVARQAAAFLSRRVG